MLAGEVKEHYKLFLSDLFKVKIVFENCIN